MNTRFAVATHVLSLLAHMRPEAVDSEHIAGSVGTNPVVIRRLLPLLSKAGLIRVQMGAGGGAHLARLPEEITLLDIYQAISDDFGRFGIHDTPNPACPVGRKVAKVLAAEMRGAEQALAEQLRGRTLADLAAEFQTAD